MSTTQDIEPFRGGGWDECSAFIQRIRAAAWKEGKLRDPGWIADFASLHLAGEALAWYVRLSPDIQEDWTKLQVALAEKWPFLGNDPSGLPNVPAAAAAPSRERREKLGYMERGILKAMIAGKGDTHYVQLGPNHMTCTVTDDPEKALSVRFDSQSNSQLFECVSERPYSWLAIHWLLSSPDIGRGSTHHAFLTAVSSETLKSLRSDEGPFQVALCRVAETGEVTPIWRNGSTETSLAVFTTKSGRVDLVPDREAFQQKYSGETPLQLFIQKVD